MTKHALVTGADRGLGLAFAAQLLERGYEVFAGRFLPGCYGLDDLYVKYGGALPILPLDVGDADLVNAAADVVAARAGKLNVLINNAGIATMHDRDATLFDDFDYDEMLRVFNVNALGMLRVTKSALPLLLKADDKRIINITSLAASISLLTRKNQYAYTMSKAAGNMQTKLIYNTLREHGVKVFALHPGWMHTAIFGDNPDNMKGAHFTPDEAARRILDFTLNAEQEGDHIFFGNDGQPLGY